jgi:tetratricopeptide (TPR) repeat protein
MKSGRLPESGEIFRLNLDREEARARRSAPTLDQWLELYRANAGLGIFLMQTRRPREAMQPLQRAGDILGAMLETCPGDPRLQRSLGGHLSTMGNWLEVVGQVEGAEVWHHRAVAAFEALTAGSPGNPTFRNDLASSLFQLGCFLDTAGRLDEAERAIRRAIDLREALVREAPADLESRAGLVLSHQFLARVLRRAHRLAEADHALRRSAELREGLLALRPDLTRYTESTPDGLPGLTSVELSLPRP